MTASAGVIYDIWIHKKRMHSGLKWRIEKLNYQGVEFPVATKHYGKIEVQNNININVFGYENEQFYPIHVSKQQNEKVSNLLLISKGAKRHYVLIKGFNRVMYWTKGLTN